MSIEIRMMITNNYFDRKKIDPEQAAYWFFRLNGCSPIVNFVIHPDIGGQSQRTDVDILAVRFLHRTELWTSGKPMQDHTVFQSDKWIDIAMAEVKNGQCRLNGPWTHPPDENLHRVLYSIGAFEIDQVPIVALSLYQNGQFCDDQYRVRLFAIGDRTNSSLLSGAVQLVWDDVLKFIHERFNRYLVQKAHHNQRDKRGQRLYRTAISTTEDEFTTKVKEAMYRFVEDRNRPVTNKIKGNA